MIHYHGTPITPDTCALRVLKARHGFVSFWTPQQIRLVAQECQSFALDNGAFAAWRAGRPVLDWSPYFVFVADWRRHPGFDFAVVPDVIEGTEQENDALIDAWPFPAAESAVVWHTNESIERLVRLCRTWPRVAIGSSGQYDASTPARYLERMRTVLPHVVDSDGYPICKLHGLRALNATIFRHLPYASGDSTNVGRNIGIDSAWRGTYQPASKEARAAILVERVESVNGACRLIS